MSRQANAVRMRTLVGRWRKEGGSGAAFAARHGVSAAKFGYWRRLLAGRGKLDGEALPVEFQPVRLVGASAMLEIAFATGERVLVHEGVSMVTLTAAITALRSRC
jgi:hypothetical protein